MLHAKELVIVTKFYVYLEFCEGGLDYSCTVDKLIFVRGCIYELLKHEFHTTNYLDL